MQKLQFESSWDKTLSAKDRDRIMYVFNEKGSSNNTCIQLIPLWQAVNHKGNLLMTVLIHNFSNETLSFDDTRLQYLEKNAVMAEHTFTIPSLFVEPKTSMPWTFIFPAEKLSTQVTFKNGHVEFASCK